MKKKPSSLSRKSILRLITLGIILFIGAVVAAGTQMYRRNMEIYQEAAGSYVNMLLYQISQVDVNEVIRHEGDIIEIQGKIQDYLNNDNTEYTSIDQICSEYSDEQIIAYDSWSQVNNFVIGFGNICSSIKYAYVVIPTEEDLVYIWDSDYTMERLNTPFEHNPYSTDEKEHILKIMRGEEDSDFFAENVKGELIGTALAPVYNYENEIIAVGAIDTSISMIISSVLKLVLNIGIAIFLIMLISIAIYHYVVHKQIINPIVTLTETADGLVNNLQEKGSVPIKVDVHTGDEIDVLARSFEQMDSKLLTYIAENAAITAEKERIGTELALASRIQEDMLPNIFPPFPDRAEIDLYATMRPAKEVGGDFYDYFMVGEDQLAIVMADVSGKGIPAALFMMMSKIMVQNFALTLNEPGKVLERVNEQICMNAVEEMFVTVWLGVLDLKTGLLTAANAGHEYPILKSPEGDFELFKDKHGLVIGGMEGIHYKEYQVQLEKGSRLFIYTDGLPEATDRKNRMFGIERTVVALNEVKDSTPREVLEHVTQSVAAFVGSAPQFDDTTMLCLDYYGLD